MTARALPLRAELGRQLGRRRTVVSVALVLALPLLLVAAFALGSDPDTDDPAPGFVDLAQRGAANFTLFVLFASTSFLLVVLVALFAGDAVPSEASWSTLRYLLAAPVGRTRLLRSKLAVALGTSAAAVVLLPVWSLLVGWVAYGGASLQSPVGDRSPWPEWGLRLLVVVAYVLVSLLPVAALAFVVGVVTDAPLAAVGTAVLVTIVSAILDTVEALGVVREVLPTHHQFAWTSALSPEIDWTPMLTGALAATCWTTVLLTLAFCLFERRDVLS